MGDSAGAMSVQMHIFSPHSKGLFHAAITHSGTACSTFCALNKNPMFYTRYAPKNEKKC